MPRRTSALIGGRRSDWKAFRRFIPEYIFRHVINVCLILISRGSFTRLRERKIRVQCRQKNVFVQPDAHAQEAGWRGVKRGGRLPLFEYDVATLSHLGKEHRGREKVSLRAGIARSELLREAQATSSSNNCGQGWLQRGTSANVAIANTGCKLQRRCMVSHLYEVRGRIFVLFLPVHRKTLLSCYFYAFPTIRIRRMQPFWGDLDFRRIICAVVCLR